MCILVLVDQSPLNYLGFFNVVCFALFIVIFNELLELGGFLGCRYWNIV